MQNDRECMSLHNVPCICQGEVKNLEALPIYRYMSLEHLVGMIEMGENVLVNPLKWEDPFEAAVVKVPSRWYDGTPVDVSVIGEELFAQCWCADNVESDLRWKAYGGGGEIVRIGTTVGRLLEMVEAVFPIKTAMHIATMFGKVVYVPQDDIERMCGEVSLMRVPELVSFCMLLKRDVYRQEDEWRILIRNIEASGMDEFRARVKIGDGLMRIPIKDQREFIHEIMLGPRLNNDNAQRLREKLAKHKWNSSVVQSSIAEHPSFSTKY